VPAGCRADPPAGSPLHASKNILSVLCTPCSSSDRDGQDIQDTQETPAMAAAQPRSEVLALDEALSAPLYFSVRGQPEGEASSDVSRSQ